MKKRMIPLLSSIVLFGFVALNLPKKPITELKELKKVLKNGYVFIPSGTTLYKGDTVSVQGFFMQKTEVSNFNYLEYLNDLKQHGQKEDYLAALPDTNKWKKYATKMATSYLRNPTYRNYPVVNITKKQAENYCAWLTKVWQQNTGNKSLKFRLPMRAEFIRAANDGALQQNYAWKGPFLRNKEGQYLCNFSSVSQNTITRDVKTNKMKIMTPSSKNKTKSLSYDLAAPVKSYYPNGFGLYNLNGNVSEMVHEENTVVGGDWRSGGYDVRNTSYKIVKEASPLVGFRPVMTYVK